MPHNRELSHNRIGRCPHIVIPRGYYSPTTEFSSREIHFFVMQHPDDAALRRAAGFASGIAPVDSAPTSWNLLRFLAGDKNNNELENG